jgi:hypothetical protein
MYNRKYLCKNSMQHKLIGNACQIKLRIFIKSKNGKENIFKRYLRGFSRHSRASFPSLHHGWTTLRISWVG